MYIVVTGAKGFVGSILSLRAIERGHHVLALDDESRGLNPIEDRIGSSYMKFDCAGGILEAVNDRHWDDVDAVVHLAAATGSLDRPLSELRALNVDMTKRVFEDSLRLNARRFIWPTTSLALGVPDSPYVQSKEEALAWLRDVDEHSGISMPVRFFNLAGAYKGLTELRKNEVHMLPMMFDAYRRKVPFVINGDDYSTHDGTPSRCFVHILDCVEYLLDAIEGLITPRAHGLTGVSKIDPVSGRSIDPPPDGAVWVGHVHPTTVQQAVRIFEQHIGSLQTKIGPRRAFDCGGLECAVGQSLQFDQARGFQLAPAWVTFRDEWQALQAALPAIAEDVARVEIDDAVEQHVSVSSLPPS